MDDLLKNNIEERLEKAYKELNVLYEVSCAMRTTLELDHVLYIILTGVTSHSGLGYNRALLFLVNPKNHYLQCEMAIGPESGEHANKIWEYIKESRPKIDDLIQADKVSLTVTQSSLLKRLKNMEFPLQKDSKFLLSQAYHRGLPWLLSPEEIVNYAQDPFLQNFPTQELLIMPLRAKGSVNGLIIADNIYTQKPINSEDIRIFSMLADQAALAIENSRLYEVAVHKSDTDSLTNLWNHGFFQKMLFEEIESSRKTSQPLSLLMVDIDNFKSLNDAFGHQNGDFILKELAAIIKDSSRESDHICRYGGEEFSIILRNTSKGKAYEAAERLRQRIAQYKFILRPVEKDINVTVSIGLSTFPDDATNNETLVADADKAMYIAKFSGKNKTCSTKNF